MNLLDVKDDKSLWEKQYIEGIGDVLIIEESYYDGIIEMINELKNENKLLYGRLNMLRDLLDRDIKKG